MLDLCRLLPALLTHGQGQTQTPPPACWNAALLKHLTTSLRKLESQEASDCQSPRREEDGHRFSDAHERLEDADAQNCS